MAQAPRLKLRNVEAHLPRAGNVQRHYFFSRSGFTERMHKFAESLARAGRLVTPGELDELLGRVPRDLAERVVDLHPLALE